MGDVPVINPDTNEAHLVPEEQVNAALQSGGKRATKVLNPGTGQSHYIPDDVVPHALQAGGQVMGTSPAAPKPQMKEDTRTSASILAKGTPFEGVGATAKREAQAVGSMLNPVTIAKGVYHAAADPETSEESQRFGKGFESKIGPTGRVIDRMVAQPVINAAQDYGLTSGKIAPYMTVDNALSVGPEAVGTGGGAVLGAKAAEVAGDTVKGGAPVKGAEGPTLPRTQIIARGVGTNVPFSTTPISALPGMALKSATKSAGEGVGTAADSVRAAATDAAKSSFNDAVNAIKADPSYKNVSGAIEKLRTDITAQLKNAKVSDINAKTIVNNIVNHLQDKFDEYTMPSVSGGSQGATPESLSFIEQQMANAKGRLSNARRGVITRPTEVDRTNETPLPQLDKQGRPVTAPGWRYENGAFVQDPNATGTARTPFSAAAASEAARGNNDLWKAGTVGQRMGGFQQSLEQEFRKVPVFGGAIGEPFDARNMTILRNGLQKAIDSLNPDVASAGTGKGFQQLVQQVDRTYGVQLADGIQKVKAMAPDAAITIGEETKKSMLAAGQGVPALEPVTRRIASGQPISLDELADLRRQIREYEGQPDANGKQVYRAASSLDKDIVRSLQTASPDAAKAYEGVSAASRYTAGQVATGVLRKMLDARSPEAFDHLIDATPEEFGSIMDSLRREKGVAAKIDSVARQGMLQRMAERSAPEGSNFDTKMFSDLVEGNKQKLGPDYTRFKLIADGMKQIENDVRITSRFGAQALMKSPATSRIAQLLAAVFGGAAKIPFVEAGLEFAVPKVLRYMMTPTGMEEMSSFARMLANFHGTPKEQNVIDYMAKKITKNMEAQEKAGIKNPIGKKPESK